jgi:hypothetical protein
MNLENRLLKDYYPKRLNDDGTFYLTKTHNVKSLGFRNIGFGYEFIIESPSVEKYFQRRYFLNSDYENTTTKEIGKNSEFYNGLLGENIMRIVIIEFFRRLSKEIPQFNFNFIKSDFNPNHQSRIILENDLYILEGISRYNQVIKSKLNYDNKSIVEYDGLLEYTLGRNTRDNYY